VRRYVDLIVNESVRDMLKARARMMGALRRVLEERGFLEAGFLTCLLSFGCSAQFCAR
jgi:lysyl-tRNA synthetase class II